MRTSLLVSAASAVAILKPSSSSSCTTYSKSLGKDLPGVCVVRVGSTSETTLGLLPQVIPIGTALVYTTSKKDNGRKRFFLEDPVLFTATGGGSFWNTSNNVNINTNTQYQEMIGFGGAFTDAAAINYASLDPALQEQFMNAYFSAEGSAYTLGRVPIASVDFSTSVYSYNDHPGDFNQSLFSIDVDLPLKVPFIKKALELTNLTLFASSWAPPAWMTVQNSTIDCSLIGSPGTGYWKSYALYLSKFFTAYKGLGINFWSMTVQNEPVVQPLLGILPGGKHWQSLRMTSKQEQEFIYNDLGPQMREDHPDLLIISFDDTKANLDGWTDSLDDLATAEYVAGTGVHWYSDADFEVNGAYLSSLSTRHDKYPSKVILATEACEGYLPSFLGTGAGTALDDFSKRWQRGENYGRDIIGDLNNWVVGWADWNLILSTSGGPNWAGNLVDSPILVSPDGTEFFQQPMYFVLAHFSKFLVPGSRRIQMNSPFGLEATAFLRPDDKIAIIVQNRNPLDVTAQFQYQGNSLTVIVDADSIQSIIFNK